MALRGRAFKFLFLISFAISARAMALAVAELNHAIATIDLSSQPDEKCGAIESWPHEPTLDEANCFLLRHDIQDAIWTLQRLGDNDSATRLQRKIVEYLFNTTPAQAGPMYRNTRFLRFPGGIRGVFKVKSERYDNPDAEVWVYNLSEALRLHIVPLTIKYAFEGQHGSLQLFVPHAQDGRINFIHEKYSRSFAALYILDFIIQNMDRHHANWLERYSGYVAIDNGYSSLVDQEYEDRPGLQATSPDILIGTPALKGVSAFSDRYLRRKLAPNVPAGVVDFYLRRRAELLRKVSDFRQYDFHSCDDLLLKAS